MRPDPAAAAALRSVDGPSAAPSSDAPVRANPLRWADMHLAQRLSLLLTAVLAFALPVGYLIVRAVVMPAFERIEMADVQSNRVRADAAIARELDQLSGTTGDWAAWDDTYRFVQGHDVAAYVESNLSYESLAMFDADVVLFYGGAGRIAWGATLDHASGEVAALDASPLDARTDALLRKLSAPVDVIEGLVATDLGVALLSARPVSTSQWHGPVAGTFVVGRLLNAERIAGLRQRTAVDLRFWAPAEIRGPDTDRLLSGAAEIATRRTRATHSEFQLLRDVAAEPVLVREIATPRSVTVLGDTTLRSTLIWLALLALLVIGVVWIALRLFVVDPLAGLTRHVRAIQDSGDFGERLGLARRDEIGVLARGFDTLLDELEAARARALEQSYKAGRAEVAAGVLHNVRNTMTPLVNALDATARTAENIVDPHWSQAIDELNREPLEPARRSRLLEYLQLSASNTAEGAAAIRSRLALATEQAREVEQILVEQERYTETEPPAERLDLGSVVRKALRGVLPLSTARRPAIEIDESVNRFEVHGHGVTVVQVIGNLLLNAHEAILRAGRSDGRIRVCARAEQSGHVALTITDNGEGIDAARIEQIFVRGVTSKRGGRGGVGLHWCANAIDQLGGSIRAASDGPGRGACLTLLLPAAQQEDPS